MAPYRLTVLLDGVLADSGLIRASGAREDRPIYVFREVEVQPGEHRLEIAFVSQRPEASRAADGAGGESGNSAAGDSPPESGEETALDAGRSGAARRAVPAPAELLLDARLDLDAREIALVGYDPERRELVVKRSDTSADANGEPGATGG